MPGARTPHGHQGTRTVADFPPLTWPSRSLSAMIFALPNLRCGFDSRRPLHVLRSRPAASSPVLGRSHTLRSCARRWRASSGRRAVRLRWCHAALAEADARGIEVLRLRWHPRQRRPCRRRCTARMTATSSDSAHDSGPSRSEQSTAPFRGQRSLPWSSRRPLATYSRIEHAKTSGGPSNRSLSCRVTDDPIARSTSYPYRTITMCTRAIRTTSLQMTEYPLDEYQPNAAQYFIKL